MRVQSYLLQAHLDTAETTAKRTGFPSGDAHLDTVETTAKRTGFLSGEAHLDTVEPPMDRTAQVSLCFQYGRSHVAGGLLLSRARFLVRLRCKITKKTTNND